MNEIDAIGLLKTFKRLQEQRVQTYRKFDEGFKSYLLTAPNYDFITYRQLVHDVTETFKSLSSDIISIRQKLASSLRLRSVANCIDRIQTLEQSKLESTAKLQITMQNLQDSPQNSELSLVVADLRRQILQTENEINEQMDEMKYETEDLLSPLSTNS